MPVWTEQEKAEWLRTHPLDPKMERAQEKRGEVKHGLLSTGSPLRSERRRKGIE